MIYLTSDLHIGHNKEFIYADRGFDNIYDMNETIIKNINDTVQYDDILYILGDLMLGDISNISYIKRINCQDVRIILGNHDTDNRVIEYNSCYNITSILYADKFKYNGLHFFLSHYPCLTGNKEKESLRQMTLSLCGHTHQKNPLTEGAPFMYNVGVDSHNCTPISLDDIIVELQDNWKSSKS